MYFPVPIPTNTPFTLSLEGLSPSIQITYAWVLSYDAVSAPLRQKCCTLTYFPVPIQTGILLSLRIQTTYK